MEDVVGPPGRNVYFIHTDRPNISPESDATTQDIQDALENILVLNEDLT